MRTECGLLLAAVVALGVGACSSSASTSNSATPGFTTTCQIINTAATDTSGITTFDIKVSVTAQKAADITDVDVEMTKQAAPLPIQSYASGTYAGTDGGNGVLMSKVGANLPTFIGAGKTWNFNTATNGINPPEFSGGTNGNNVSEFTAVPDSCQVSVVATTSNPGNF